MASFHHRIKSAKKGAAVNHAAYIVRSGKYSHREDLVWAGFGNMPWWAENEPSLFWQAADQYERVNGAVYREHEIALPDELTPEQQKNLVNDLIAALARGKPYQYAVHAPNSALEGVPNTHLHLMYSDRAHDDIKRSPEQTFSRYNGKHPERGGCKKDSGGKTPLALRDDVIETRRKCAELQNIALANYGHDTRVDHRTLKQQGIKRMPEHHLGAARIRNMSLEEKDQYVADRQNRGEE